MVGVELRRNNLRDRNIEIVDFNRLYFLNQVQKSEMLFFALGTAIVEKLGCIYWDRIASPHDDSTE